MGSSKSLLGKAGSFVVFQSCHSSQSLSHREPVELQQRPAYLICDTERALSTHLFVHGLEVAWREHDLPQPALLGMCAASAQCYTCGAVPRVGRAPESGLEMCELACISQA